MPKNTVAFRFFADTLCTMAAMTFVPGDGSPVVSGGGSADVSPAAAAKRRALADLDGQVMELLGAGLDSMVPVDPSVTAAGLTRPWKYDASMHAKLCQMRFLGMTEGESARACGISPVTLGHWLREMPQLKADMDRAGELSKTRAALRLQQLMDGDGVVAFQAVKFYLTTHSEAFQERQHVHVEGGGDRAALVARIRESVYGIVVRKDEAGEGVSRVGGEGGGVDGSDRALLPGSRRVVADGVGGSDERGPRPALAAGEEAPESGERGASGAVAGPVAEPVESVPAGRLRCPDEGYPAADVALDDL